MLTCFLLCGNTDLGFKVRHYLHRSHFMHKFSVRWLKNKRKHFTLSQNFISTCRYLDDHCQYSSLFSYIKIYRQRQSTEELQGKEQNQSDDKHRNTTIWTRTSPTSRLQPESFPSDDGTRNSSLVDSMRRTVTGQMQEPDDDVTGVAVVKLDSLVVSFLFDETGLVCGTALWFEKKKEELWLRSWLSVISNTCFKKCCYQILWHGAMDPFRVIGQMYEFTVTEVAVLMQRHSILLAF